MANEPLSDWDGVIRYRDIDTVDWGRKVVRAIGGSGAEVVAATNGAVASPTKKVTIYSTNATANITIALADGSYLGEEKIIKLATDGGNDVVITPTNFYDGTTITLDDTKDYTHLIWDGTNWNNIGSTGTIA